MTLCTAWLRRGPSDEGDELIVATDSMLTGGEKWSHGLKLFHIGRPDCLLCFAGDTARAYPLILHAANSARFNVTWADPRLDVYDVLDSLTGLFTELCSTIEETAEDIHAVRAGAEFLFVGWSWRHQHFGVWRLFYEKELEAFTSEALHADERRARLYTFIGDYTEAAEELLKDEMQEQGSLMSGALDMEPFLVLARMARDEDKYREIGGALQVAKIYRSGNSEFFGVMWPSTVNGHPHVLGRPLDRFDAPPTRLLDPDSGLYVDRVPLTFTGFDDLDFGDEEQFVRDSYPAPDHRLDSDLPVAKRDRLERVLRGTAYDALKQTHDVSNEPSNAAAEEYAEAVPASPSPAAEIAAVEPTEGEDNGAEDVEPADTEATHE